MSRTGRENEAGLTQDGGTGGAPGLDFTATRVVVISEEPFDRVREALESRVGRTDFSALRELAARNPGGAADGAIAELAGPTGLMIVAESDHGALIAPPGSSRRARLYLIGNPLIARRMAEVDLAIGLYVPIRVYLYEAPSGKTHITYDRPSSVFAQFEDERIARVAGELDAKFADLATKAARAEIRP